MTKASRRNFGRPSNGAWNTVKGKKTPAGVIASDSDEMEGRIPTGYANLSTSSLTFGALTGAIALGSSLGIDSQKIELYRKRADELKQAIDDYFGANIQGLHSYRYFDGHEGFRHWICLPLLMGIFDRAAGTTDALFSHLWTPLGLRVQSGVDIWWDRGTLYALNAVLHAGFVERAMPYLQEYTHKRLLGEHVPYAMEAYPENNQAHLAAESALYGRVIVEGLFGVQPAGLNSFTIKPSMPAAWNEMSLRNAHGFGHVFDVSVRKVKEKIEIHITKGGKTVARKTVARKHAMVVKF